MKDLERSIRFYTDIFGFHLRRRFSVGESKMAILDVGVGSIELIQRPGAPAEPPKGRWSHIAFQVKVHPMPLDCASDTEDLLSAREEIDEYKNK